MSPTRAVARITNIASRYLPSGRTIYWTPQSGRGFGNYLYYWLIADAQQRMGVDYRVLHAPSMDRWLTLLPSIQHTLTIPAKHVAWNDKRETRPAQRFGVDFTRDQLEVFIENHLSHSDLLAGERPHQDSLTINIRRGDYYNVPHIRTNYGFNLEAYLDLALERATNNGEVAAIQVVSDDINWCKTTIGPTLGGIAPTEYIIPSSAENDFRVVANSARIIGTNSTFTYWAGYVSNFLYGARSHVVMPDFHARHINEGRAWQLDPDWDIVSDIPGGWDLVAQEKGEQVQDE